MAWLKSFYEKKYGKQAVFAAAMNVSDKTVQRWENHSPHGAIPFARIAGLLVVDEEVLRKTHAESLAEYEKRKQEETIETNRKNAEVEAQIIREAIEKVGSERFLQRLQQSTGTDSLDGAVAKLAEFIEQEQIDSMRSKLDRAITDFCGDASSEDVDALVALRGIYRVILRACAISPLSSETESERAGCTYTVLGAKPSHPLIFAYDRANSTKGYHRLVIANEHKIDDSVDTTRCIRLSDLGADSDEEWAHNCVKQIGKTLGGLTMPCPEYNDPNRSQLFPQYCSNLNDALYGLNTRDTYVIARQDDPISSGVATYLEDWLGNLHRFDCSDHDASRSNIMRGDPGGLGAWMAQGETALNKRLKTLGHVPIPQGGELEDALVPQEWKPKISPASPAIIEGQKATEDMPSRIEKWSKVFKNASKNIRDGIYAWVPK